MTVLLNKKRMVLLFNLIIFSIISYAIVNKDIFLNNGFTETVATPVTNKVVILDARSWFTRCWSGK